MNFLYPKKLADIYDRLATAGLAGNRNGIWYEKHGVTIHPDRDETYQVRVEMRESPGSIETTDKLRELFRGVSYVTVDSPRPPVRPKISR